MKKLVGAAVILMLAFAACDDFASPTDEGPGPGPAPGGGDLTIQKISGDGQTAPAGVALDDPYVVKVVDEFGGAVPGIPVRFQIEGEDGGSISSSLVFSDSAGDAAVTARLPGELNVSQTVVVTSDSARNSVSFTSETTSSLSGPARIRIVSGEGQKGIMRDTLLDPLVVEVSSQDGVSLEGVNVRWKVISGDGGGAVLGSPTATDSRGVATNQWRLGDVPQATDSMVAFIEPSSASPDTVMFTAEVTGTPDSIVVTQGAIELDNNFKDPEILVGDTVFAAPGHWSRQPFKAIVRDAAGDSVRGATLTWTVTSRGGAVGDEPEDGGNAETVMVITDEEGGITVWRRAPDLGSLESFEPRCVTTDGEGNTILDESFECWIGATLSLERYPEVTPVTLDALIRGD